MSRCRETSGILMKRPCPNPAVRRCARTGMPICEACTRWVGQEALSISAMKQDMADRHRRGEPIGQRDPSDPFLFPYWAMGAMASGFTEGDYALFELDAPLPPDDFEGDWEGS